MSIFRLLVILSFSILGFAQNIDNSIEFTDSGVRLISNSPIFDTSVKYRHKKIIKCNPAIDATYKMVSPKKMEIIPRKFLKSSQSYSCIYKDREFKFTTDNFGLDEYIYFEQEKLLRLEFNDAIDKSSIKNSISIFKKKGLSKTALMYDISSQSSRVLVLKIKEVVDGDIELEIRDTLSTIDNQRLPESINIELGKDVKEPVTLNPKKSPMLFKDLPVMIAKEDGSFAIRVFFNDSFYGEPFREFISIDGVENLTIDEDNYISYKMRKEYKITDSYYYIDIMSSEFKPNSDYTLHLDEGLVTYNKELKEDKVFKLHSGDRKKVIFFNDKKPYLSNLGEIGFSSINTDSATIIIDKITPSNYRYFIGYNSAKQEDTSKFTKEIFAKDVVLDNPKNIIKKQKILLKDIIGDVPYGVYRITIKYEDRDKNNKVVDKSASKVVFVSDIGILTNLFDNQAFISLSKLSDTTPIVGAKVDIYSKNNIVIASTISDENGIAIVDKDALIASEPKAIIVSTDNDKSFLLLDKSLNSNSYKKLKAKEERYSAFIYFQSDIIRPAKAINALISVKDRDFISASKLPIKITLSQLYSKKIFQRVYNTDEFGLIDFTYTMSNEDKTGKYILQATLGDRVIGKKVISVEAFMPPKIENKITTDKKVYTKDEFIEANISSNYLFGMPSSFLGGKVNLRVVGVDYTDSKYSGYSFTNRVNSSDKVYINSEYDISLDKEGKVSIYLPCDTKKQVPSILKATIEATIIDDTQPVSTYKDVTIYPYRHLVGVKLNNSSLEESEPLEGSVVLIDPVSGESIDRELSVIINKIEWHYTYSDGNYQWDKESIPIDRFTTQSNQKFSRDLTQSGDFEVVVYDRLNSHSASTSFEITGWGYTNISPDKNLKKVDIDFEDRLYKKGDIIKASIKSPIIKGRLLISLEGSKVEWHRVIDIQKGTAQIDIPIEDELNRGAYLHAVAIRDTSIEPSIIPFRVMGYKFIKSDRRDHQIDIKMEYNSTSHSNRSLPLTITTSKETALLVSVVDSGILNITSQKPPKIFDFFNPMVDKKSLYFDIYDEVMAYITDGTIISFGAGDTLMAERTKKHLPPANLDRVKPFMLWSNIIYTKDKKATLNLDIPEFNGRATIVAIAINADSIGVSSDDIIIKDDIMIKPSYPRFILKGDKIEVPIRVFNTTKDTQKIKLDCNISYNLEWSLDNQEIELAPNSSKVIRAKLTAKQEGKASIVLSTKLDEKVFKNSVSLEVMNPYSIATEVYQDTTSSPTKITIPHKFNHGKMIVSISDNILGQLRGDLKYLISYPHGCAEQTSSKISAMFYSKPFLKNDQLTKDADNFIRQGIKKLSKMQNYYGEFAYWEEGGYVNPYASIYASETLLALDKAGYLVEDGIKQKIIKALQNIVDAKSLSTKYSDINRVYAGYVLSLYNELPLSSANMLYDKRIYDGYYISWYYMSAIFKSLGEEELSQQIYAGLRDIKLSELKDVAYNHIGFSSESRDMFLIFYLKSKHFKSTKYEFEIVKRQLKKLYSTHEKAIALRAISEYIGEAKDEKMSVELVQNNSKTTYTKSVVFTDGVWDRDVYINPLSGVVSYNLEVYKPLPRVIKNELLDYKKLSISREFIDINGDIVNLKNLQQGSKIYSKVSILNNERVENVLLNQRIPACMDIVNSRVTQSSSEFVDKNLHLNYKDIRDDRILYFMDMPSPQKSKTIKDMIIPNITTVYTPLIVTTIGECKLPALTIEAMYDSRLSDYAKQTDSVIVKSKNDITKNSLSQKSSKRTDSYIKNLAREYYMLEASSTNPRDFIKYFNYPITRYFNYNSTSKDEMLEDKANYNKDWPNRDYNIKEIEIVDKDQTLKVYRVKLTFEYKLKNPRGKTIKGVSIHLITFREIKGRLLIDKIEIF